MLMLGGGIFRISLALSPAAFIFWTFASTTNALVFLSVTWSSLQGGSLQVCLMLTRPCAVGHPEECGAECDSASACRSFITTFFFFFFLDGLDSACIPSWMFANLKKKKNVVTMDLCYILRTKKKQLQTFLYSGDISENRLTQQVFRNVKSPPVIQSIFENSLVRRLQESCEFLQQRYERKHPCVWRHDLLKCLAIKLMLLHSTLFVQVSWQQLPSSGLLPEWTKPSVRMNLVAFGARVAALDGLLLPSWIPETEQKCDRTGFCFPSCRHNSLKWLPAGSKSLI